MYPHEEGNTYDGGLKGKPSRISHQSREKRHYSGTPYWKSKDWGSLMTKGKTVDEYQEEKGGRRMINKMGGGKSRFVGIVCRLFIQRKVFIITYKYINIRNILDNTTKLRKEILLPNKKVADITLN